ncbi:hypothetical protein PPL_06525 [Heterostelium album PN500]|uniref:glycerol kinase n=1 Tax=Heterostelium pallidum (strain ATCC 26659 / Pp 5 / PN500) TaxID=670386 RepID=D3BDE2_HETP5|nr:hypothetical protein PPL_06525 [Heterostelium album PN500]EFA80586.1 hypothetical protein PPL_06525 [Heterostelium album PN500]|eukprot:XP_020432706.1 hypothetical protein PPL_06525 [Heterostelium album PN500]
MYVGIDLGTSAVKVVLMSESGSLVASHSEPLTLSRPYPLWSEQDPAEWWQATDRAVQQLNHKHQLDQVVAIGLSGQMHGATLLDKNQNVLRPAILWNDGRCAQQCEELESLVKDSRRITGNLMMTGFTAPKLKWVAQNEPEIFKQIDKVLLPKDYLRWKMAGVFASDMSDSAGTMWLDVGKRDWSDELLAATGLDRSHMPALYEGTEITGELLPDVRERWGMKKSAIPVIAGGGDCSTGAIGVGVCQPGQAMLSIGTSGVYFAVSDNGYLSNPTSAVHSFCHALPNTWHLMSVMLSGGVCLNWVAKLTGLNSVEQLMNEVESHTTSSSTSSPIWFLPYLSGERTPHNNPNAKGVFFGLTLEHQRADLCKSVLEGVGFSLLDGMEVLHETGFTPTSITLVGGGAHSSYWRQMLADITGYTLLYSGGEVGPAIGAARLAMIALNKDKPIQQFLPELPLVQRHTPNQQTHEYYKQRRITFKQLYQQNLSLMS